MSYVGFDASYSSFGAACVDPDYDGVLRQVGKFDPKKFGSGVERLEAIQDWVSAVLGDFRQVGKINGVALEGYAPGSKFGREIAGELGAAVKMQLRKSLSGPAGYPHIVQPSTLKKFATGSGAAKKEQIILAVFKKYGIEAKTNDEADAIVLAKMAQALDFPEGLLAYEKSALAVVKAHTEMR